MRYKTKKNDYKDHLSELQVAGYVDSLLADNLTGITEPLKLHVQDCEKCKKRILEVTVFLKKPQDPKTDPVREAEEYLATGSKPIAFFTSVVTRIAALFVFSVISLGFYFFMTNTGPFFKDPGAAGRVDHIDLNHQVQTDQNTIKISDRETKPEIQADQPDIRQSFNTNHNLELMVNNRLRSLGPMVLSPKNGIDLALPIVFEIKGPLKQALYLKILNNKNETIYEYTLTGTSLRFNRTLKPGLYYWKLENDKDLLYVGKFYIKKPR